MRNKSLIFWFIFLVHGVFGADEVSMSVMVGDYVTLHTVDIETQGAEKLQWRIQGENTFIAIIDRETSETSVPGNDEERFSGRLGVNSTTGSLNITNLRTTDSRVYELQIKNSKGIKSKIFNVDVRDDVVSLSVMKGDSVTLHTGVKVQGDDQIVWKFGDQVIPITNLNSAVDGIWSNTHQNESTRDLTISNIRRNQTGDYKMEINTSSMILHRKFSINVSDEMKTVSVKEGEPVTLDTGLIKIKGYDLILWKFENHLIARINRNTNQFLLFSAEGKFEGRLQRDLQTESLIIRDSRTTDSGDYHLNMSNSTHTLQKTITVNVTNVPVTNVPVTDVPVTDVPVTDVPVTERSIWKTAFIVVVVVFTVIIIVMIIYNKKILCWKKGGAITNPSSTELLPTGQ